MDDERRETIAAYDASADEYAAETAEMPGSIRAEIERFAALLGGTGRVLEIGTGGGRDAVGLEECGLSVRRTDITPAFVEILRRKGFLADVIDPLTDDLTDPQQPGTAYDAVWAQACLMHVYRHDVPTVLARLAEVTRRSGLIFVSVTEGDGDREIGEAGRRYHQMDWRESDLRQVVAGSGWEVDDVWRSQGKHSPFLNLLGHRADPA